ncbi:STAS domain-containing protein [Streptomyces sp. NPDC029003]|uniref:STAS domain-containing protein n=1 Tax=Streptomyces sp. NPDC029003 TaxID=3155125 RepID=UPI0033D169A5
MTHPDPASAGPGDADDPLVTVDVEPGPERVTARIRGEIDMDDAPHVRADLLAALEASSTGLDVDLSALTFCDSAGLHLLLHLNRLAAEAGKTLTLRSNPQLDHLLDLTETRHLFTIHGDTRRDTTRSSGKPSPKSSPAGRACDPATGHFSRPSLDDSVIAYTDEP